jgi:hypothetical protein
LFSAYGLLAHLHPVVFQHALLLPINLVKLWRLRKHASGTLQD